MRKEVKDLLSFPHPSQELLNYYSKTFNGQNEEIPTYGMGRRLIADFYGKDPEGNELARFVIPWGRNQELEKSYSVKRTVTGEFQVRLEGFYPRLR